MLNMSKQTKAFEVVMAHCQRRKGDNVFVCVCGRILMKLRK